MNDENGQNQPAETIEQTMARMVAKVREEELRKMLDEPEFRDRIRVEAQTFLTRQFDQMAAGEGSFKGWTFTNIIHEELRKHAAQLLKEPEWRQLIVVSLEGAIKAMPTGRQISGEVGWRYVNLENTVAEIAGHMLHATKESITTELRERANKNRW